MGSWERGLIFSNILKHFARAGVIKMRQPFRLWIYLMGEGNHKSIKDRLAWPVRLLVRGLNVSEGACLRAKEMQGRNYHMSVWSKARGFVGKNALVFGRSWNVFFWDYKVFLKMNEDTSARNESKMAGTGQVAPKNTRSGYKRLVWLLGKALKMCQSCTTLRGT